MIFIIKDVVILENILIKRKEFEFEKYILYVMNIKEMSILKLN